MGQLLEWFEDGAFQHQKGSDKRSQQDEQLKVHQLYLQLTCLCQCSIKADIEKYLTKRGVTHVDGAAEPAIDIVKLFFQLKWVQAAAVRACQNQVMPVTVCGQLRFDKRMYS